MKLSNEFKSLVFIALPSEKKISFYRTGIEEKVLK